MQLGINELKIFTDIKYKRIRKKTSVEMLAFVLKFIEHMKPRANLKYQKAYLKTLAVYLLDICMAQESGTRSSLGLLSGLWLAWLILSFSTPVLASYPSCREVHSSVRLKKAGREEALQNIWAVHATKYFPSEGILYAGFPPGVQKKTPVFRPEVHFALGELVVAHEYGNWEKMPFAVLTPLASLERQLLKLPRFGGVFWAEGFSQQPC